MILMGEKKEIFEENIIYEKFFWIHLPHRIKQCQTNVRKVLVGDEIFV